MRDCRVLDGLGGPAVEGELWIVCGRIAEPGTVPVGRSESLGGRVVAPGLIDAHVHVCLDADSVFLSTFCRATPDQLMASMRQNAEATLRAGVTTVRDLGSPTELILALRNAIASGRTPGPRILASGTPMTIAEGHFHEMGGAVQGTAAIRDAVRALSRARVDVVKVMATGGGSSPQTDPRACQFTDDEMRVLVEEASLQGLPVACHAHANAGIHQAVGAGVSTIEHGSYASESSLRAMVDRSVAFVPTLAPAVSVLDRSPYPAGRMAAIRDRFNARRDAVRLAVRLGVRVVAGTDAGVAFTPHGSLATEIVALAESGVPPALALAAAGREAAAALGMSDTGVLSPDARADLIVLEGDPLSDVRCLARPLAVMQEGRWVKRLDG